MNPIALRWRALLFVAGLLVLSACASSSTANTDGAGVDLQIRDALGGDGAIADTVGDAPASDAYALGPQSYFISPRFVTDVSRREFSSIAGFLAEGPTCMAGGEKIWLESGRRFLGPLTLKNCSGATGAVSIATYGGTQRATITGAQSISELGLSWTHVTHPSFNGKTITYLAGTPIYRVGPISKEVQQLYYGGTRMSLARRPNEPIPESADAQFFSTEAFWEYSPTGCLATTCVTGIPSEDGLGPLRTYGLGPDTFAVIRTSNWTLQRSKVTWVTTDVAKSGFAIADSLRTPANGNRLPTAGYGFVLLNALPFLDHTSEWVWDRNDQYLYFWAPDDLEPEAASTLVNFTADGSLISARFGAAPLDLVVTDLIVERAAHSGVRLISGRHLTVERVKVIQPEVQGVSALSLTGKVRVADSEIAQPGNNGVTVYNIENAEIVDNVVTKPGRINNQPALIMNFNGIRVGGGADTVVVERNTVRNAGYAGVMLGPARNSLKVADNKVEGFCKLLNDCGGIYYNGQTNTLTSNQTVTGNTFSGGLGNINGIPANLRLPIASGVYLDHGTSDFVVRNNTVTESHSKTGGIYLHGGNNNVVEGNRVNATYGPAFCMRKIEPSFPAMSGNTVTNNSFTTSSAAYAVIRFVDPSGNSCTGMSSVISGSNTVTHTVTPSFLEMCR